MAVENDTTDNKIINNLIAEWKKKKKNKIRVVQTKEIKVWTMPIQKSRRE